MTENNLKLNREYKDALFKFIFGNEARKEYTLSLFNELNENIKKTMKLDELLKVYRESLNDDRIILEN